MSREINLDTVAELVRAEGIACVAEQTGGGVATLFAGMEDPDTGRRAACAGPGWFERVERLDFLDPRASDAEFYVGPDDEMGLDASSMEGKTDQEIAAAIVAVVRGEST